MIDWFGNNLFGKINLITSIHSGCSSIFVFIPLTIKFRLSIKPLSFFSEFKKRKLFILICCLAKAVESFLYAFGHKWNQIKSRVSGELFVYSIFSNPNRECSLSFKVTSMSYFISCWKYVLSLPFINDTIYMIKIKFLEKDLFIFIYFWFH